MCEQLEIVFLLVDIGAELALVPPWWLLVASKHWLPIFLKNSAKKYSLRIKHCVVQETNIYCTTQYQPKKCALFVTQLNTAHLSVRLFSSKLPKTEASVAAIFRCTSISEKSVFFVAEKGVAQNCVAASAQYLCCCKKCSSAVASDIFAILEKCCNSRKKTLHIICAMLCTEFHNVADMTDISQKSFMKSIV